MTKQYLSDGWTLKKITDETQYSTHIPSSVYTVLSENHVIPDPYWKDNEYKLREILEDDFEYRCIFDASSALLSQDIILLRFYGLDTLADITLNGIAIGTADNMHRTWEYSVKPVLKEKVNHLTIVFHSPFRFAAREFDQCPTRGSEDAWDGFSHIRKAHYMFGWDWGAHLPDAGIFRDVVLIGANTVMIDSFYVTQEHSQNLVTLAITPSFKKESCIDVSCSLEELEEGYSYCVTILTPDGTALRYDSSPSSVPVENPRLWWPNGLGEQPLYTVTVTLFYHGTEADCQTKRMGLRTLTISRKKDEWGETFAHEVNGQTVFAMGADYIPEDHLLGKKTKERTRQLLSDCREANFNCIRVWGGGYYPDDYFYDLCDEMGFIVWQDFMFACSVYELTPAFETNITREFIDNIKRIRHHACLGLWCGNNEMESFVKDGVWVSKPSEVRDYLFMYERIIPAVLKEYDPVTFYWPSSPSSGGSFDEPQDPNRGDVHYWQVWHGNEPFSEYRKFGFRYLSEFGFQALPSVKTIEEGISDDPQDFNLFSYVLEKHQRNNAANGKIINYLQQTYLYPYDFSCMVYASQLLQADAIRYGVEHFRRNRGRCMGAVYWQLNDCWPVISWSSIDYYGRWKALHYYAKRFFSPVMLSCEEQNWMTAKADMNRQHFEFEKSIRLNVTNETLGEKHVTIRWALRNNDASIVRQEEETITVPASSALWLDKVLLPKADLFTQYISYEALWQGNIISGGTVIFSLPKYFRFLNPKLQYELDKDELIIHADAYAKSVEILNEKEDLILSDNYFDMNAGCVRVKILRGSAVGIRLRSVYDIGRV